MGLGESCSKPRVLPQELMARRSPVSSSLGDQTLHVCVQPGDSLRTSGRLSLDSRPGQHGLPSTPWLLPENHFSEIHTPGKSLSYS